MKRYIPILIAGMSILPIAFEAIRKGSLFFTALMIVGISIIATIFASRCGAIKAWKSVIVFAFGALVSEAYYYYSWFTQHGKNIASDDPGITIATIEWAAISVIGAVNIIVCCYFINRIPKL